LIPAVQHPAAIARPLAVRRPAAGRLVNALLFVTILVSPFVRIEPAPYEGMVALLAIACFAANISIDRRLIPLIALLVLWNVGGLFSLMPVLHDERAIPFVAVSIYLAISAILIACLFTHDIMRRLDILQNSYVIAAVAATLFGIVVYFFVAGGDDMMGRVRATFKDPNVFGPFLILPILLLAADFFQRGFSLWRTIVVSVLLFGLLISFSRGAWLNFGASAAVMAGMMFLTAPTPKVRFRLIAMGAVALVLLVGLIAAALSIDVVADMFVERAKVTQYYDVGDGGRFTAQARAVPIILDHPNGVGPHQLRNYIGIDPHQVYLNAFASYGWLGGTAYLALILSTLLVGFRYALVRSPWGAYLIAAFAAFFGTVAEGFVIDTDHWRHFYLLLGLIWGLSVATRNALVARRDGRREILP